MEQLSLQKIKWGKLLALCCVPAFLLPGWWSWPALILVLGLGLIGWRSKSLRTGLEWPLILLLVSVLIGLWASLDLALSLNRAWSLVAGLVTFYTVNTLFNKQQINQAGTVLVGFGLLAGAIGLIGTDWGRGDLLKLPFIYDYLPHLLKSSFGSGASAEQELNPRVIAGAMAMLVPLGWSMTLLSPGNYRWLRILAALFLTFVLLLTQAPTAIGGLLVASLITFIVSKLWRYKWLLALLTTALIGLITLTGANLLTTLARQLPPPDSEPTLRLILRLEMWLRSFDMLADKPFTGIGLNNFPQSINNFYPAYSLGSEAHAHNILLQTAVDGGLPGLLAFGAVLGGVSLTLRKAWQANQDNKAARALLWGIAIGTLSWLFYGVGESITLAHKPALILWAMWGLAAGLARNSQTVSIQKSTNQKIVKALIIVAVLVMSTLLVIVNLDRLKTNLAIIEGQRAILQNDLAKIAESEAKLREAIRLPNTYISAATLDLMARLEERQGNFSLALDYLGREAGRDANFTSEKYIPAEWSIWRKSKPAEANPLIRLYRQWQIRYPENGLAQGKLALAYAKNCDLSGMSNTLKQNSTRSNSSFLNYLQADANLFQRFCRSDLVGFSR